MDKIIANNKNDDILFESRKPNKIDIKQNTTDHDIKIRGFISAGHYLEKKKIDELTTNNDDKSCKKGKK